MPARLDPAAALWRQRLASRLRAEQARARALRGDNVRAAALRAAWAPLTGPREVGPDVGSSARAGGAVTNPADELRP